MRSACAALKHFHPSPSTLHPLFIHMPSAIILFHPLSIYFHPLSSTSIYFHIRSIYFHPIFHLLPSTAIYFHPLPFHFHPLSSIFIYLLFIFTSCTCCWLPHWTKIFFLLLFFYLSDSFFCVDVPAATARTGADAQQSDSAASAADRSHFPRPDLKAMVSKCFFYTLQSEHTEENQSLSNARSHTLALMQC